MSLKGGCVPSMTLIDRNNRTARISEATTAQQQQDQQQDSQDLRIESKIAASSAKRGLEERFSGFRTEPKRRFAVIRP